MGSFAQIIYGYPFRKDSETRYIFDNNIDLSNGSVQLYEDCECDSCVVGLCATHRDNYSGEWYMRIRPEHLQIDPKWNKEIEEAVRFLNIPGHVFDEKNCGWYVYDGWA